MRLLGGGLSPKTRRYFMFLIYRGFQFDDWNSAIKISGALLTLMFMFPATQVDHVVNFQMPMGALGWRSILVAFFLMEVFG